ncbi:uncharacterized protein LOC142224254 [Haematobia irritans]|uniref:uncharacterized protein LOC142224254 n=1 Tax=Haematobia irritans TaxID=7368 RepID=UPI003F4F4F10
MVLKTTVIANDSALEKTGGNDNMNQMVVNTTDFNDNDFNEFVNLSEAIERNNRQRRSKRRSARHNTMVATMTREELFECTNVDDDQFLKSLEYPNSFEESSSSLHKTVLLNSIDNLMKYFDEDVDVPDNSVKNTPIKLKTKGKVASAVASFRNKAKTPSPLSKRKNKQKLEVNTNVEELKKRYETPEKVSANSSAVKSATLSPKMLKKSKVKQMALLFNNKMNSIMRKGSPEPQTPEPISPGLESIASPTFTSTLKPKSPKLKTKAATFIAKLPSPRASPLFKRRQLSKSPSISSLVGSPGMKRKPLQKQPSTTCLVAESVFQQLSVKDKALLYNKFIEDMSKKNPKFSKHGQILESNVQKEIARGEVVCEKQGSVKHLRDSLEAKLTPTKALSTTLQRFKRSSPESSMLATTPTRNKSKEFEDVVRPQTPQTPKTPETKSPNDSEDLLHVSTLTVVLKPSPEVKKYATKPRSNRRRKDVRFLTDLGNIEPSFKRTQEMIRSSVIVEPFAPPKKIRRTQHERLAPKMFFQNQHLEKLFYNWLKEKNGVAFDITPVHNKADIIEIVPKNSRDNVIPKHQIDQLLEEAINRLEADKQMQEAVSPVSKELSAINLIKETLEEKETIDSSVIEVELPFEGDIVVEEKVSNAIKESNDPIDSDLGVTSITKTASEDSHTETKDTNMKNSPAKQTKPNRKKKLRRSLTWKKDYSLVESNPVISTDSDSDCRSLNRSLNRSLTGTLSKSKKCTAYVKKLLFKTANTSVCSEPASINQDLSIVELDRSLMRQINSPSKIKDAYTLTVMSSPSPPNESDFCDSDLPRSPFKDLSRSWPSLLEAGPEEEDGLVNDRMGLKNKAVSTEFTDLAKHKMELEQHKLMVDSFIDQGFETGSNEMESPMRPPKKSYNLITELVAENPKSFSTPHRDNPVEQIFTAHCGLPKTIISPIQANTPMHLKNPHMEVIKEDCSLEDVNQLEYSPSAFGENASFFSSAEATHNSTMPPLGVTHKVETSQFWISAGDFTAAVNIHHYEAERLMLLSNIFAQKYLENHDITFGIDDQKFSEDSSLTSEEIRRKIPQMDNCSQYWFSTGDVLLPFAGKPLTKAKIQTFFGYIREFADDKKPVRFGIDSYEFSNTNQSPTATNATYTWTNPSPIKTSDLDQSDFESVELEQSISFSALSSNQSDSCSIKSDDLALNQANNQTYSTQAVEGLKQIFEDARHLNLSKTQTDKLASESQFTVPEMLKTLHNQQEKLKNLEERMLHSCANPAAGKSAVDQFQESPEYMRKLRNIITAIDNIGRGNNGFHACSIEQLESFMFFLSRYADLCLANCTAHIEKILDVVMNQRSFQA